MNRIACSAFAVCALAAFTGVPVGNGSAPVGLADAAGPLVISKSASMWINRREYIVTISIQRLLVLNPSPIIATDGDPMQVQIIVQSVDGAVPEWMSSAAITIRGARDSANPSLNEQPQIALWPSNMRSWAGYYSKNLKTSAPNARFSVRIRGREYAVNINGIPITPGFMVAQ